MGSRHFSCSLTTQRTHCHRRQGRMEGFGLFHPSKGVAAAAFSRTRRALFTGLSLAFRMPLALASPLPPFQRRMPGSRHPLHLVNACLVAQW